MSDDDTFFFFDDLEELKVRGASALDETRAILRDMRHFAEIIHGETAEMRRGIRLRAPGRAR